MFNLRMSGKDIVKHPLFSGSAIMIVGSNFANFIAYIYHLIIGRLLGPSPYGELAAILSIIGLFSVAFTFMSLVIVKFVSSAKKSEIPALFEWFNSKAILVGIAIGVLLFLATPLLSDFLHIKSSIVVFVGPVLIFFFASLIYRSFLLGLLRFKQVIIINNAEFFVRLVLSVLFVLVGFSVFGATLGIFLSAIFGFFLSRAFLKDFRIKSHEGRFRESNKVISYAIPLFLISLAKNSIISADVVLVKHFFNPFDAGLYASLSTLGKIIFYGSAPISAVMFPLVSQRQARGKSYLRIFLLSLILTALIAGAILLVYWLLPDLSIRILYGEKFIQASPNLVWFGLFAAIFTLSSLISSFYLSRGKTEILVFIIIAAVGQVVGIWFFHETILTVITVSIIAVSFLLSSLLIYLGYEFKVGKLKK